MQIEFSLLVLLVFINYKTSNALKLEQCTNRALGLENGDILDSQITASSSFDKQSVGPQNARLNSELASGAWCPKPQINSKSFEYLQISLNSTYLITSIETQGRYGNGTGREFASEYLIEYKRGGSSWMRYRNRTGHILMTGNFDTTTVVRRNLDPPVVASKIRIVPTSKSTRTVCLRAEIIGCQHHGVIFYSMAPEGSRLNKYDFKDTMFEETELFTESGIRRGLGLLTDGYTAQTTPFDSTKNNSNWIGWNKDSAGDGVNILFEFEDVHNFTDVILATFGNRIDQIDVIFSPDGKTFPLYSQITSSERQSLNNTSRRYDFRVPLHNRCAKKIRMTIKFSSEWMFLTEIHFNSVVADVNSSMTKIEPSTSPQNKFLVLCGIILLTLFTCIIFCVKILNRRRRFEEKNCEQNLKRDLIITHMGNKPSCHVFPSGKNSLGPYELTNEIYYAKSPKSTLLSVSSKNSSYRPIPPTWSEFHFPPPPPEKEEHIYSQPVTHSHSISSNSSMCKSADVPAIKKYPNSSLMLGLPIGEGKFTIIRECMVFGRKVAHKSNKEQNCLHGRRALNDEIDMLRKCGKHVNVIELIAVDENRNLLLEFAELGNVYNFLNSAKDQLEVEFLVSICNDVANGLRHLETMGIVHGHLTNSNILLTSDLCAKICSPRGPSHHAQLRYSAPECITANEFTHKSDVWSFAICVWEMCYQCRTRPYSELTNDQIIENACALIDHQPYAILMEFPSIFSSNVSYLLKTSFSVNKDDRPPIDSFVQALSH